MLQEDPQVVIPRIVFICHMDEAAMMEPENSQG